MVQWVTKFGFGCPQYLMEQRCSMDLVLLISVLE